MGTDRSSDVVERVADVLARLGGDPRGARPDADESGTDGAESESSGDASPVDALDATRTVTDGGADGAPPGGESPWVEDDPIVFGEDAEAKQESALLDAVTDPDAETAPPFGDGETVADPIEEPTTEEQSGEADDEGAADAPAPDAGTAVAGVDPERLDELEARIEALESDHVHLDATMTDTAAAIADLQDDVDGLGDDVRRLVALLGGVAIANAADDRPARPPPTPSDDGTDAGDGGTDGDEANPEADDEPVEAADSTDGPATQDAEPEEEAATATIEGVPDGIHRGAGEPPEPPADPDDAITDDEGGGEVPAPEDEIDEVPAPDDGIDEVPAPDDGAAESGTTTDPPAAAAAAGPADDPSRELVDPRTEAVGARLRQFREGFVDDPTADLPTGDAADEFRFDKILLPTDGEAAPDLSAGELEKPYLASLPDGYAADAVVLEWLDWLVSASDGTVAARAIAYYESIEWLTDDVREELLGYLDGLGGTGSAGGAGAAGGATADEEAVEQPPEALDLQDHLRSLQYVTELASGEVGSDGV